MPNRPCPNCHSNGPRHLEASSQHAQVDYYRCDACGHVWTVSKDVNQSIRHVTPLQPPKTQEKRVVRLSTRAGEAPQLSIEELQALGRELLLASVSERTRCSTLRKERLKHVSQRRELVVELRSAMKRAAAVSRDRA